MKLISAEKKKKAKLDSKQKREEKAKKSFKFL